MGKKNYVLDTNVLLHDAQAMYAFADNNVVIPIYVLEEIDNFKKDLSELGRNARHIAREAPRTLHSRHVTWQTNGGQPGWQQGSMFGQGT